MKLLTRIAAIPFFVMSILLHTANAEDIISSASMFGNSCNQIVGQFSGEDLRTYPYDYSTKYSVFNYSWAKWTVTENSDNTYSFHIKNYYLLATKNAVGYLLDDEWKKFTLEEGSGGGYYLKTRRDTYLSCEEKGKWKPLTQVDAQEDATRWYFLHFNKIDSSAAKSLTKTQKAGEQPSMASMLTRPNKP